MFKKSYAVLLPRSIDRVEETRVHGSEASLDCSPPREQDTNLLREPQQTHAS